MDDEQTIPVSFNQSTYRIKEYIGTLSPVLTLDRPSPCGITVFAELVDDTATGGGVDYGYPLPIIYEFIFLAGETCATPVDPIPIIDDRISERDERFKINIIKTSLPLGVRGSRNSATITIEDNDIACSFETEAYEIDENKGPLQLRLKLDKSPTTEINLQVYDLSNTANAGEDYTPGPYLVTFRRGSRTSNEFSVSITKDEDDIYTGNKNFNLTIVGDLLPFGLALGDIVSVNVTIVDDEYTVCFNQPTVTAVESRRVELFLRTSKRLSRSVRVNYIYSNGTGHPATPSPPFYGSDYSPLRSSSVTTTTIVRINTMRDDILEFNETFAISIPSDLIHNTPPAADCITRVDVLIIDDDFTTVEFQRTSYPPSRNKHELLKLVLELSDPIAYPIQVTLQGENGTAKSGEDYVLRNPLVIIHPNTQRKEIYVHQIDDDIVEILTEEFYINIVLVTDRNGAPDKRVSIGRDKRTRLQIRDDDATYVTMINGQLQFSKPIYRNVSIEIQHRVGPTHNGWLLARESIYKFNTELANIIRVRVCIPKPLYDERPRRVNSGSVKVQICSLTD